MKVVSKSKTERGFSAIVFMDKYNHEIRVVQSSVNMSDAWIFSSGDILLTRKDFRQLYRALKSVSRGR
jgi:hypothetical protein